MLNGNETSCAPSKAQHEPVGEERIALENDATQTLALYAVVYCITFTSIYCIAYAPIRFATNNSITISTHSELEETMNSRPTSTDESPTTRLPARARFTPSPPSHAFDYGSNDKARTAAASSSSRSKSGINGRDNLDDEDELTGRMGDREMNKRTAAAANAAKQSLDELERDFSLARSNSNLSSASGGGGGRDRPWRTASSSGGSNAVSPSSISSVSSPQYNPSPRNYTSDRWAQYETDDLAEQSRRATSNAVVDMATKFADKAADEYDGGFSGGDEMMAPMGGSVGTGLRK
eukprot:g5832.t1 g5832   contig20:255769-256644(+)